MNTKEYLNTIKETIKAKEKGQRFLKNQRKTVRLVGERHVRPSDATYKVFRGKFDLTDTYIAYYCLKHRIPMTDENKVKVLGILMPNHNFENDHFYYHNYWDSAKKMYDKWYSELEKIFENEKKDME